MNTIFSINNFFIALFILLASNLCSAENTVKSPYLSVSSVSFLSSTDNNQLSINRILANENIKNTRAGTLISRKPSHEATWLKIDVNNNTDKDYTEILDTHSYLAHNAEAYITSGDGLKRLYIRNKEQTVVEGDLNYPYLAFPVTLAAGSSVSVYLKVESYFPIFLQIAFISSKAAQEFRNHHALITGLTVSFFLVIAFINLTISFAMKKRYFLWFTAHEISVLLFCLSQQNSFKLLPSDVSQLNSFIFTICLLLATANFFFINQLKLTARFPASCRWVGCMAIVFFLIAISCLFIEYTYMELMGGIALSGAFSILAILVRCSNIKETSSALILMAVLVLMTTSALIFLMEIGVIPKFLTHHEDIVPIGHAVVSLLFFSSLASHIHKLRKGEECKSNRLIAAFDQAVKDNNTLITSEQKNSHLQAKLAKNLKEFAQSNHDFHNNLFGIKLLLQDIEGDANGSNVKMINTSIAHLEEITEQMMYKVTGNPLFGYSCKEGKPLNNIFNSLSNLLEKEAEYKNITLKFVYTSQNYEGIEILMKRLLENIARNAIRYTPVGGKVLIGVRISKQGFKIQVIDNGIGMSRDKVLYLMQDGHRFEQSELGFGLGFTSIRNLCDELNFKLNIESAVGLGSKITLGFNTLSPLNKFKESAS